MAHKPAALTTCHLGWMLDEFGVADVLGAYPVCISSQVQAESYLLNDSECVKLGIRTESI